MGLPRDGRLQVQPGLADRQPGGRIADRLEVLQVAVGMARLAFGSRAEHGRHVIEAFDIRLRCEIQVSTIRLRLTGERLLEIVFRLAAFEIHVATPYVFQLRLDCV